MDSFLFKCGTSGNWSRLVSRSLPNAGVEEVSVGAAGGLNLHQSSIDDPRQHNVPAAIQGEFLCFLSVLLSKHLDTKEYPHSYTSTMEQRQQAAQRQLQELVILIQHSVTEGDGTLTPCDRWRFVLGLLVVISLASSSGNEEGSSLLPVAVWTALYTSWSGKAGCGLELIRQNPSTLEIEQFITSVSQRGESQTVGWAKRVVSAGTKDSVSVDLLLRATEVSIVTLKKKRSSDETLECASLELEADCPEGLILSFRRQQVVGEEESENLSSSTSVVTMSEGVTLTLLGKSLDAVEEAKGKVFPSSSVYATPILAMGVFIDILAHRQANRTSSSVVVPHLATTSLFFHRLCMKCANTDSPAEPLPPPTVWTNSLLPRENEQHTAPSSHQERRWGADVATQSPTKTTTLSSSPRDIPSASAARPIPAAQRQIAKTSHRSLDSSFTTAGAPLMDTIPTTVTASPAGGWNFSQHEREEYLLAVQNIHTEPPVDERTLKDLFYQLATEGNGPRDRLDKEQFINYLKKAYPVADCGDPDFVARLVHRAHSRPCAGSVDPRSGVQRRVADYRAPARADAATKEESVISSCKRPLHATTVAATTTNVNWRGLDQGVLTSNEMLQGDACAIVGKLQWEHDDEGTHPLVSKWSTAALHQSLSSRKMATTSSSSSPPKRGACGDPTSIASMYLGTTKGLAPPSTTLELQRVPKPSCAVEAPQELQYANSWLEQGVQRRLKKEREAEQQRQTQQLRRPDPPTFVTESEFITVLQRLGTKM